MDFNDFECFAKIVRCGSITAAAKTLLVSQQALSARMKKLESELGAPLFTRTNKGIVLTAFGKNIYDRAVSIIDQYDAFIVSLGNSRFDDNRVSFAATPFVTHSLGDEIFNSFADAYKEYPLDITELDENSVFNNLFRNVRFLLVSDIDAPDFMPYERISIGRRHRCLFVNMSDPLAQKGSIRFSDLGHRDLFVLSQRIAFENLVKEYYPDNRGNVHYGSDPLFFLSLISQNKGVMIADPSLLSFSPYQNIKMIPVLDDFLDFHPGFVFQSMDQLKKQDKIFIQYILEKVPGAAYSATLVTKLNSSQP